jgi:hypothetical protein
MTSVYERLKNLQITLPDVPPPSKASLPPHYREKVSPMCPVMPSKYAAILTFPLTGELPHKTDLPTICQLLKQADALKLRALVGEETLMKSVVGLVLRNKPKEQKLERRSSKLKIARPTTISAINAGLSRVAAANTDTKPDTRGVEFRMDKPGW